jgi:hypothetical protein
MTLATWKAEFFPELKYGSALEAVENSLKKWQGALPENLAKHGGEICKSLKEHVGIRAGIGSGLLFGFDPGTDERSIEFNSTTCSLCEYAEAQSKLDPEYDETTDEVCRFCPIYAATDGRACTESYREDGTYKSSEFTRFIMNSEIDPMIGLLERTKKHVLKQLDDAADAKFRGQMLDAAETEDEKNDILRQAGNG